MLMFDSIEHFKNSTKTIRIQDSGSGRISEEQELDWIGPTLKPNQRGFVAFNATGVTSGISEQPLQLMIQAGGGLMQAEA